MMRSTQNEDRANLVEVIEALQQVDIHNMICLASAQNVSADG